MKKLSEDFKKKWVKALRSGEYNQGTEMLMNKSGGYCCLGVSCDILGIDMNKWGAKGFPEDIPEEERPDVDNLIYESSGNFYPDFKTIDENNSTVGKLAWLNDNGASFSEIADYIEATL